VLSNKSSSGSNTVGVLLNGTSQSNNGLYRGLTVAANTFVVFEHWLALNPGDVLRVTTGATAGFLVHVFGALLLGAPS